MRATPEYRVFPWWPENGDDWIHPQDVALVRKLIPSARLFRREGRDGDYLVLGYGALRFRVKPSMRQAIRGDGFGIGDCVEVRSDQGRNRPFVGRIAEMCWNIRYRRIVYRLRARGMPLARWYRAEDLRHVERELRPVDSS